MNRSPICAPYGFRHGPHDRFDLGRIGGEGLLQPHLTVHFGEDRQIEVGRSKTIDELHDAVAQSGLLALEDKGDEMLGRMAGIPVLSSEKLVIFRSLPSSNRWKSLWVRFRWKAPFLSM